MDLPAVAELEDRAAALFSSWRVVDSSVRVVWNDRLTTTVGRAFLRLGQIELNPHLLTRAPDQLEPVLVHEAAHLAAFRLFGPAIPPHGRHWRSLMRLAGQPPKVTHDIPVEGLRSRRRRRYWYLRLCGACGNRRIQTAVAYGRCASCDRRDSYLVLRAPATPAGFAALAKLDDRQVRACCERS